MHVEGLEVGHVMTSRKIKMAALEVDELFPSPNFRLIFASFPWPRFDVLYRFHVGGGNLLLGEHERIGFKWGVNASATTHFSWVILPIARVCTNVRGCKRCFVGYAIVVVLRRFSVVFGLWFFFICLHMGFEASLEELWTPSLGDYWELWAYQWLEG